MITGVSLSIAGGPAVPGQLTIAPPHTAGGYATVVSMDLVTKNVTVTVKWDGAEVQIEEFNVAVNPIYTIVYNGGVKGGDTFTNNTGLTCRMYGYESGNVFVGGTGINFCWFMTGAGNTYTAQGAKSVNDIWSYAGANTVNNPDGGLIQAYKEYK